ncbi:MAG: type 1 glutamine amidotransferase, partial [Nitrososphaerales archaeon]
MFEKDDFVIDRLVPVDGDSLSDTIEGYNALVILGGPSSVYENHQYLRDEQKLIQNAMTKEIPTLGICLGSQLLAKAAGAKVYKGSRKEIGWYPVDITNEGM